MQRLRRPGRGWFHLRVMLFAAVLVSVGLTTAENRIRPGWEGWIAVRYVVGSLFVLALLLYGGYFWHRRRNRRLYKGSDR